MSAPGARRSVKGRRAGIAGIVISRFWTAGKRDLGTWDYLVRLIHRWNDIEDVVAAPGRGPWFMAVGEGVVSEVTLRTPRARPADPH